MSTEAEFVITVPQSLGAVFAYHAKARLTLGVLVQMVAKAQQEIVISSPYMQSEQIFGRSDLAFALESAINRGVRLKIMSTGENLQLIRSLDWVVSNQTNIEFYQPQTNIERPEYLGSHAKFCLVDKSSAYIGSANFTYLGLHQHLEMGIVVYGEIAERIAEFWHLLVQQGYLQHNG